MEAYLDIIIFFVLLTLGYVFGQSLEKSHYRSIIKRESQLRSIPVIASKILPDEFLPCQTEMVSGTTRTCAHLIQNVRFGIKGSEYLI